jgi:3-oxoacyl-[acyl-carrier protein] reductase
VPEAFHREQLKIRSRIPALCFLNGNRLNQRKNKVNLEGKTAVVTGAGSGIGRAVAHRLSLNGARVIVNDVLADSGNRVVQEIMEKGAEAVFVEADIATYDGARKLAERGHSAYGRIDILVNNAGMTRDKLLRDMEEADWDAVLTLNLKGVFNCCKFITPDMMERGYGKIVNLSSRAHLGNPGQANYAASKAGIIGLTKSLALELGRYNINVNAVAPGMIETEGLKAHPHYDRVIARALQITPLNRIGKPEDVAALVHFLVGDDSNYITGEVIHITGGRY